MMAKVSKYPSYESNVSKEEGEITDDDEIEELKEDKSHQDRDKLPKLPVSVGRRSDADFRKSYDSSEQLRHALKKYSREHDGCSSNRRSYSSKDISGDRYSSSRDSSYPYEKYSSSENEVFRNSPNRSSRELHQLREPGQRTSSSAKSSWMQRRFYSSSGAYKQENDASRRITAAYIRSRNNFRSESVMSSEYQVLLEEYLHINDRITVLDTEDEVEGVRNFGRIKDKMSDQKPTKSFNKSNPDVSKSSKIGKTAEVGSRKISGGNKSRKGKEILSDVSSSESESNFVSAAMTGQNKVTGMIDKISSSPSTVAAVLVTADLNGAADVGINMDDNVARSNDDVENSGMESSVPLIHSAELDILNDRTCSTELQEVLEDDELDELELRRLALASAAHRAHGGTHDNSGSLSVEETRVIDSSASSTSISENKSLSVVQTLVAAKPLQAAVECIGADIAVRKSSKDRVQKADILSQSKVSKVSKTVNIGCFRPRRSRNRTASEKRKGEKVGKNSPVKVKERSVRPLKKRPLPFAPVKLDKICLKSVSRKKGSQTVQQGHHQSVACPLSSSKQGKASVRGGSNSNHKFHRSSDGSRTIKKDEDRKREIAEILSLKNFDEQVERFLHLIRGDGKGRILPITTRNKVKQQQPPLKDNYEEVEMEIDTSDEITEELQLEEFQTAMQPIFMGCEQPDFNMMEAVCVKDSMPLARHSFTGIMPYGPSPLPPPPPPPPLPEDDLPRPPPPPPPDPESSTDSLQTKEPGDSSMKLELVSSLVQMGGALAKIDIRSLDALVKIDIPSLDAVESEDIKTELSSRESFSVQDFSKEEPQSIFRAVADTPESPNAREVENNRDADTDEDEEILRAQLIQSVMVKRKEHTDLQSLKSTASASSDSTLDAYSPQRLIVTKSLGDRQRQVYLPKIKFNMLPKHKPVVIPLGETSSEDEEDSYVDGKNQVVRTVSGVSAVSGLDIDNFLKAQRNCVAKSVCAQTSNIVAETKPVATTDNSLKMESEQQQQQLLESEEELSKKWQDIVGDQILLRQMLTKAGRFQVALRKVEARVATLQEQLQAAEKLAANCRLHVQSSRSEAKNLKDILLKKKEMYQKAKEQVVELGQNLFGVTYSLSLTDVKMKRKVISTSAGVNVVVQPSAAKRRKLNPKLAERLTKNDPVALLSPWSDSSSRNLSADARAKEKERLLKLAEVYEKKLHILKLKQAQQSNLLSSNTLGSDASSLPKDVQIKPEKKQSRMASLESIKLEPEESEESTCRQYRRRSLLNKTQSPKPTLLLKDRQNIPDEPQVPVTELKYIETGKISFKLPSGLQLSNLCKIQKEKVDKILLVHNQPVQELFSNLSLKYQPVPELKLVFPGTRKDRHESERVESTRLAYTSYLLHFKAYRFSPYYRTKANLCIPSVTFSNKLNVNRILCRYDLQGTCNDEHCTGQHERDYKLSDKEILEDLVAYCPRLAGIDETIPQNMYEKQISEYVDNLMSQHKSKMSTDDLCVLLSGKVTECAKHVRPHTMFSERRTWKPSSQEPRSSFSLSITSQFHTQKDTLDGVVRNPKEIDSVLDCEDVRYFVCETTSGTEVQDMEGAVLATPGDTDLWLRLAYCKLTNPARSSEECLDQALNVLSRGLECNKNSHDLWVHYLALYRRHADSANDYLDLCQTALHYASCCDICWQLLEASTDFQAKNAVCDRVLSILCDDEAVTACATPDIVLSHQMLEILLYKVSLNIQTGRFKTALNFMQRVLGVRKGPEEEKRYLKKLVHADRCVMWTCLVHLMEFQSLPAALYDPANHNPSRIVCKEKLLIPWHSKKDLTYPFEVLVQYIGQAVSFDSDAPQDLYLSPQYTEAVHNLAELLRHRKKWQEACEVLKKEILQKAPLLTDLWLLAADIYAGAGHIQEACNTLLEALSKQAYNAKLCYYYVVLKMSQGCADEMLEHLEQFIISHFEVSDDIRNQLDPNILFCKVLNLDVPLRKKLPQLKDQIRDVLFNKDHYVWLCFCLLLELQGETSEAVNIYELALSSTIKAADLSQLWKCYIQFLHRCHAQTSSASTVQQLQEAIMRSITTAPTQSPYPFPRPHQTQSEYWPDFSHLTSLVEFYLKMMPLDSLAASLHTFYDMMPDNVPLLIRSERDVVCGTRW